MPANACPPIISLDRLRSDYPDAIVCDCRAYLDDREGIDAYRSGHIPGARFIDLETVLSAPPALGTGLGRHPLASPEVFAAGLAAAGIDHTSTVVAYDDNGGMIAGRLVWMLRTLGQPAALLDGGIQAWDGELERETPDVSAASHPPRPWPTSAIATAGSVETVIANGGLVIDSRGAERYAGENETIDPIAGHIPGAQNLPFAGNIAGGRFRSPDELKKRFTQAGVDDQTIYYCGSGVSACHNMLAAEAAGFGRGVLYPGSWSGWIDRDDPKVSPR